MDAISMRTPFLLSESDMAKPIILPNPSEKIWEKFEYFDKLAEQFPEYDQYDEVRWELLDLWFEQFQKEYKAQGPIFKKGGKNNGTDN